MQNAVQSELYDNYSIFSKISGVPKKMSIILKLNFYATNANFVVSNSITIKFDVFIEFDKFSPK